MKTVLLLDDSRTIRFAFTELIRQAGYEAQTAQSAEDALRFIAEHGIPDLIISDIQMPGMGGMEFCQRVRSISEHTPIIVMSAFSDKKLVAQAPKLGIHSWMLKPVEPEYFINKLKTIFDEVQALST